MRKHLEKRFGIVVDHLCNNSQQDLISGKCTMLLVEDAALLHEYKECKRAAPEKTSACVVVPANLVAQDTQLRMQLKGMEHLCSLVKGLPCQYNVYYDRPCLYMSKGNLAELNAHITSRKKSGKYCVLYPTQVNGTPCTSLMDSGADDMYISEKKARELGLDLIRSENPQKVSMPGGCSAKCNLQVRVLLGLKGWQQEFTLQVIKALPGNIDLLLGMRFLTDDTVQAKWDFYTRELFFGKRDVKGNSPYALTKDDEIVRDCPDVPEDTDASPLFLSAMQLKRIVRKGQPLFLCHVRYADDQQDPTEKTEKDLFGRVTIDIEEMNFGATEGPNSVPREKLKELVRKYSDVFPHDVPPGIPENRGQANKHLLVLEEGMRPVKRKQYRLSPPERAELERQIKYLLKQGWIKPSGSAWGAPVLFAPKGDGSLRLCTDYRALNKGTVKNRFPLPNIEDLIDQLQGAKIFSSIDLAAGYHQIAIPEADREKTAFFGHDGLYEYCVVPFGLCNAPAVFMDEVTTALRGLIGKCCVVYLDDILVYSKTPEEHLQHLELVLQRLREHRWYARLRKCEFNQTEIKYLGHIINEEGRRPDPDKVAVVKDWTQPKNVHELRSFLGLTNYFRKYMRGYAKIAAPLHHLTKSKTPYVWDEKCETAFQQLKENLITAPILTLPDDEKPYTVISDASGVAGGAILMQDGKVVAYFGRKWSGAELKFSVGEQELLAIVDALREWRCYLEGKTFEVFTDHNPLIWLQTQPSLSRRQAGWMEYLQRFHIQWRYRPGARNIADPISRAPSLPEKGPLPICDMLILNVVLSTLRRETKALEPVEDTRRSTRRGIIGEPRAPTPANASAPTSPPVDTGSSDSDSDVSDDAVEHHTVADEPLHEQLEHELARELARQSFLDRVAAAYAADPWYAKTENITREGLILHANLYWKDHRLAIPENTELREEVLRLCHDAPWAGHLGRDKSKELLQASYWWPRAARDIDRYVAECYSCQRNKPVRKKPLGRLQPLDVPRRRFEWISVDFITDLPVSDRGNDCIVVFADRLSKFVRLIPAKLEGLDAPKFAEIFEEAIDSVYGTPLYITSDRDPRFTSTFWSDVCALLGVKQRMSTAFHPQTNGQVEHVNGTIEEMLRHFVGASQEDWDRHIGHCQKAYNNSWHPSIGCSPAEMLYGQRLLNPYTTDIVSRNPAAMRHAGQWHERVRRAKRLLLAARQRQRKYYDKKHGLGDNSWLQEGAKVLVSTRNIRLLSKAQGETRKNKLLPRFLGPFVIEKRINEVAFKVKLPEHLKIHNVFHISLLREFKESGRYQPPPPPVEIDGDWEYEVERVLNERKVRRGRQTKTEFFVQWKGHGVEHNTWEPEENLARARGAIADYRDQRALRTMV